ncbi:penicillin binding protein [Oceanobacillus iheyensis HTE831]|uniref:Penicillin binding protein n=1 Tax=Oceanobacillus iheyensis (strain DSM 14371 / CIP 107618 / JCM 11309 / KCTC 3954 / HTE831) TaxID=221109 RepID=Q8ERE3_OCEIH|nr:D-alanyl-D-alanine carboxypeptidase/D-alanyl-D-alanine-endopeptidase [Oceanobacillus iheyensis]BAC13318.1 penicillin binding protein [Oceanobacillus iheyensis HTE831]
MRVLKELITYISKQEKWAGGILGLSVRSADTGDIYFSHNGDIRLHPASNMKILTAVAALKILGPGYRFTTEIRLEGKLVGDVWEGDVYIVGKGDPTLQLNDYQRFATILHKYGIRKITGSIIADDTWYDDIRLSEDLIWSDAQYYYGAEVSALTLSPDKDYDTGSVKIIIKPGQLGDPPEYQLYPNTSYVMIENHAVTVDHAEEEELCITREHNGNRIYIKGKIGINQDIRKEWMAVWGVTDYVVNTFVQALNETGITIKDKSKTGRSVPSGTACIHVHSSPTLAEILIPFMKLSNNGIGEMLVKEMGRFVYEEGTWEAGLKVMKEQIQSYGVNMKTLQIKDGSGISHNNLLPANELTHLLHCIQTEEWFPLLLDTLPLAGEQNRMVGGTLRERMKGLSVKAKTGTIEGVSTLSGYIKMETDQRVIFSILLNNLIDGEIGKEIEDEIVTYLHEHELAKV